MKWAATCATTLCMLFPVPFPTHTPRGVWKMEQHFGDVIKERASSSSSCRTPARVPLEDMMAHAGAGAVKGMKARSKNPSHNTHIRRRGRHAVPLKREKKRESERDS